MGESLQMLDDARLWDCFKTGQKAALKLIYERNYACLFNYGKKLTSHTAIAEDCIQDLFLKLWKNRQNLGQVTSIRSYLYKSYRRILLDLVKVNRKYSAYNDLPGAYDVTLSIEEATVVEEEILAMRKGLKRAINSLSKRQREIIYLSFYQGFTYSEIAEIISIKNQTIRNCVYEAMKSMRNFLQKA